MSGDDLKMTTDKSPSEPWHGTGVARPVARHDGGGVKSFRKRHTWRAPQWKSGGWHSSRD